MNVNQTLFLLLFSFMSLLYAGTVAAQQGATKEDVDQLNASGLKFLLQPDSLIKYADKAYNIARAIGYKSGEATALKLKGIYEHRKGNPLQAIAFYQDALQFFQSENNELEIAKLNLNIATSYNSKSDLIKTTQYALLALKGFERTNFLSGKGRVMNLLGISAFLQKDYRSAKAYFLQYNALVQKAKDTLEVASSYNNLGSTYLNMKNPDSAIYYFSRAAEIHQKKKNLIGYGIVQENIGSIYMDVEQNYPKALYFYKKCVDAFTKMGAIDRLSHGYMNMGTTYGKLKDTLSARKYLNMAIEMATKSGEKVVLQRSYQELSAFSAGDQKFREAYASLKTSMSHSDSIWNIEKVKAVEELKTKYNTEKKELTIRNLHQQNEIKDLQIARRNAMLAIGGGLLLALLVIGSLVYSRQRLKAASRLQLERNRQQEEAAKFVLAAEERERQRIATDLHDGVGQLLSTALLSIKTLAKKLPAGDVLNTHAERSIALVTESYDEVRTISHQMIPNALLKSGLVAAVRDFLNSLNSEELQVNLAVSGISNPLDEQTEIILYRVLQEAVNNVIKYAKASKLHVQLTKEEDAITLSIEDNGRGFNMADATKGKGIGLQNIISRVQFLKGTVDFDSKPGKGTVIIITVPG